jgi:hypothetical protein
MPSVGFKLMIPAVEQLKAYAFDCTATMIGTLFKKGKKVKVTLVQALRLCTGRGWVGVDVKQSWHDGDYSPPPTDC